ncbi:MAG: winged helix-turn-helix transcriptional regulator [Rhodospirillaceae bacterium]|nr:winged helix-turn-helix transcriptional regulator [Rhodospirillaceae bacterium]
MASDKSSDRASVANEVEITLGLLNAIERDSGLTQRTLANELGIALGLANAYLKRCAKKGLIKVAQVPANRYAYYLTPQGFAEKSRLTARYLAGSFNLFRHSRKQYDDLLAFCATRGWRRVAFAGVGDLAEIAILCATNHGIAVVGLLDGQGGEKFHGLPVVNRLKDLGSVDAVLVTDMEAPQAVFDALIQILPRERVLAPRMLNVSREMPRLAEPTTAAAGEDG